IHGVVELEDGYIKLSAKEEDGDLLIFVSDNGCGMPKEVLEQLNEGYQRLPGQHLGLYNVRSIIRLHYGETYGLTVESEPENGSCICLRLPIQKGERNAEGSSN
ncbi:MAG: ATP-binding protein, partial [Lachnospiraceae bacterium]|nr:ATP-binding protein [Lachnospiraceae bacterium]